MKKTRKPRAVPREEQRQRPRHGGSFIRDPKTGELECIERTKPAGTPTEEAPATEPESGADQTEVSGDPPASTSGSTGDTAEQEG